MHIPHELKIVIGDIAGVAQCLWSKGWAEQNAGNISVDVSDLVHMQQCLLVTVAGSRMRDIAKAPAKNLMLMKLSKSGKGYALLWGGNSGTARPTSEIDSHLAVHALLRKEKRHQKVFMHTHPTHLIALSHIKKYGANEKALNDLLFSAHPEVAITAPDGIGTAPYRRPGTKGLSAVTLAALKHHRVVIWEKHGCAAIGDDVNQAFDLIDVINKAAAIYLLCKASGNKFQGLTKKQIGD